MQATVTSDMDFLRVRESAWGDIVGYLKNGDSIEVDVTARIKDSNNCYWYPLALSVGQLYADEALTTRSTVNGYVVGTLIQLAETVADDEEGTDTDEDDATTTPPATTTTAKPKLGVNVIFDGNSGRAAIKHGAPVTSITFNPDFAKILKETYPSLIVAARPNLTGGYTPSIDEWWSKVSNAVTNGMYLIGLNESDHGVGTSVTDIKKRIDFDIKALARVKSEAASRGITLYYCGGGFSTGEPNIVDESVIKAMYGYAPLMEDPHFRFNQHSYATSDGRPGLTPVMIRDLVFDDSFGDYSIFKRINRSTGLLETFNERIYQRDWTISRWHFYYRRCGWNPLGAGKIVSDETGLDIGSVGGFPSMSCSADFVANWAAKYLEIQSMPLIIDGTSYASPFEWAAIFQTGNTEKWKGYEINYAEEKLQANGWGAGA